MNIPNFVKWVIPIITELFKGDENKPGYFKRHKTIALCVIAMICCGLLTLFMFEQAHMHGIKSKKDDEYIATLTEKLKTCELESED